MQIFLEGCQAGLVCVGAVCAAAPSSGPCAAHGVCAAGVAFCSSQGTCEPLKPDGAACSAAPECLNGDCQDGRCRPLVLSCHE